MYCNSLGNNLGYQFKSKTTHMSQQSHGRVVYLLLTICLCLGVNTEVSAQLDNSCSITVNGGISIESSPRPARMSFSVPYLDHIPWTQMDNIYLPDNRNVETVLPPGAKSEFLIVNDFDFDIPVESTITGIEVRFIGSKAGTDTIRDKRIQLVDGSGAMIGQNKYNRAIFGNEWNQDSLTQVEESGCMGVIKILGMLTGHLR